MKDRVIISAIIFYCCFALFSCKAIINKFAFYPDTKTTLSKQQLPLEVKEIYIETDDKERLHSYWISNTNSKRLLIYFHGNAGNISHRLSDLMQLSKYDVNVLGIDYRGYGKSSGKPSEEGIYLDGKAAYKYALETLGFLQKNIFVFGRSIGTTVAIDISQNKDIAGLILVSPLTSGKAQAKEQGLALFASFAGDSFNNISKIHNIRCPLLVIHGTQDEVIPFSMGKEIFRKAKVIKQFVAIDNAGHNNLSNPKYIKYWEAIFNFLEDTRGLS